jgi:hypothetical protein
MIVSYTDETGTTYEVSFEYDPDLYGEEDPSQSPWNYISIESITDSDGGEVEFDEDQLWDLKKYLWKEYKHEL